MSEQSEQSECPDDEQTERPEEEEEWYIEELAMLGQIPILPRELQDRIFGCCDMSSLAVLCQLNKDWHERTVSLLWTDIDFVRVFEDDVVEHTRKFFALCDTLMNEQPERWAVLAPRVRKLNLGRLYGINIVHERSANYHNDFDYIDWDGTGGARNVFDVIAQFTNLHTLSVHVKDWWGFTSLEATGKALAQGITNLKSLRVGGEMPYEALEGLLATPETIEHLSFINLIDSPGQDNGPDGMVFLSDICDRFTCLRTLHLCKLADLDPRLTDDEEEEGDGDESDDWNSTEYASGMRWKFPRESEVSVLNEWATLLHNCSSTLVELTLENRYLVCFQVDEWDRRINPGVTDPADWGAFSIRESQRILFPALSGDFPKLKKLTLVGLGEIEDVTQAIHHLEPRVQIEQRFALLEKMGGDATPENVSTPVEFYDISK